MTAPSLSFTLLLGLLGVVGIVLAIMPYAGWDGVLFRSVGLSLLLLGVWLDNKLADWWYWEK